MTVSRRAARSLRALRGAVAFLTRFPTPGGGHADWDAFRHAPWTFPAAGILIGTVAGSVFLLQGRVPATESLWPSVVAGYLCLLYLLTGVTHADGIADVGDAIAVHDPDRRVDVLKDSAIGVGGVLALLVTLLVLVLGVVGLATAGGASGTAAFRIVLAAEVSAKLGMALLVCLGTAAHEGLGSQLADVVGPIAILPAVGVALMTLIALPSGTRLAVAATLTAGPAVALILLVGTRSWLGGISGDVLGATNELGRAVGIHAGVVVWVIL